MKLSLENYVKYDLGIPGIMSEEELLFLHNLVNSLADNSLIVELGVLVGRTSAALYLASQNRHRIISIDKFGPYPIPLGNCSTYNCPDLLIDFQQNMIRNNISIMETDICPSQNGNYFIISDTLEAAKIFEDISVDLVFEDSDHPRVGDIIDAWPPKLKSDGIFAGHDWIPYIPEWHYMIDEIESRFQVINPVGSIWVKNDGNGWMAQKFV